MFSTTLRVILMTLVLACVNGTTSGQDSDSKPQNTKEVPSSLTGTRQKPNDRDLAIQYLYDLMQADFLRQPDDVAQEIVVALNGAGLPKESRSKVNEWYARLLRRQIESWETSEIRANIGIEKAKQNARRKQMEKRLAKIATELAELASDAEGTNVATIALETLKAAGYVVSDGHVLKESEANRPFGMRR